MSSRPKPLDPRAKLALVAVVSILAIAIPHLGSLAALAVVLLLVVGVDEHLSVKDWLRSLEPFKVLIPIILVLNTFFYGSGQVIWNPAGIGWPLALTVGGINTSLVIAARLLVIAAAVAWFTATTAAESFEVALTRLGAPWMLAFLVSLTLRLVPEIRNRFQAIEEAQRSRGLVYEGGPIERTRALILILVPFLVSVIRYGFELGEALEVRGYGRADRRTYQETLSFGRNDVLLSLFAVVLLVAFAVT